MSITVINTRPSERAAPLSAHLQASGMTVVDMPMLALNPLAVSEQSLDLMRRWQAGDYQALVVVSPTAAALGLEVWHKLGHEVTAKDTASKTPSPIIAVGAATAAVLHAADCEVRQPKVANNEGMLMMPEIARLQAGDKLLIWRGLGGRRLLVDTLQARGVHIDSIAWYERTMPDNACTHYQQWAMSFFNKDRVRADPKPMVIISSGTAFEHWEQVVQATNTEKNSHAQRTLADFRYIVLGARLADMLDVRQLDFLRVEDLDPETILRVLR